MIQNSVCVCGRETESEHSQALLSPVHWGRLAGDAPHHRAAWGHAMRLISFSLRSEPLGDDRSCFCKNNCDISSQTWSEFTAKWKQSLQSWFAEPNQISLNGCFIQSAAAGLCRFFSPRLKGL